MEPVHYIDSIAALAQQPRSWKWTPAHAAIVAMLWGRAPSTIAVRPRVRVTQAELSAWLGVGPRHIAGLVASLKGVAFKVEGEGGQARSYTLLRPTEHETANAAVLDAEREEAERKAARAGRRSGRRKTEGERKGDYHKLAARFRDRAIIARQLQAAFGSRELLYTGPEVHAVLDWLTSAETEPDAECFDQLLALAVADPDKPERPECLCMSSHRAWRERLIDRATETETET